MDEVYDIRSEIIKLKRVLMPMEELISEMIDDNLLLIVNKTNNKLNTFINV